MLPDARDLRSWVDKLAHHRVAVVGDVILDEYVIGKAQRMSREAPIPVLELQSRHYIPGGAANPAANIVALDSHALQVGIIGDDTSAHALLTELKARAIDTSALIVTPNRPTSLKTRIMAQMGLRFPQQVARIDALDRTPITSDIITQLSDRTTSYDAHAIIASDYHNGLLVPNLIARLHTIAQQKNIPLIADAQGSLDKYAEWHVVKCNADDASAYLGYKLVTDEDFSKGALQLYKSLALKQAMVITRGAQGATLAQSERQVAHVPAPKISDVFDTVGAGDTIIAIMTLALIAGADMVTAVMLANYASGIVVRYVGNYTPKREELMQALTT